MWPEAADALVLMEQETGGLVYSDILRSAEGSLAAMQSKRGVQPPGFSGHNFGFSFDIAVDNYLAPGMPKGTALLPGTLTMRGWSYDELIATLAGYGFYCHRRDGKRGAEDWHWNFLGGELGERGLSASRKSGWSAAVETVIFGTYGSAFALDDLGVQAALKTLGFYRGEVDGIVGPQTRAAVGAFQRAWKVGEGPIDARTKRVLAFVAAEHEIV